MQHTVIAFTVKASTVVTFTVKAFLNDQHMQVLEAGRWPQTRSHDLTMRS